MKNRLGFSLLILSTVLLPSIIGCKDIEIKSTWRNRDIIVDGSDREWKDLLLYHAKSKIAFGSCNDDKNLYLILVIGDRSEQRQIMRSGLTVYFDGTGGSDESFAVRFPLGMRGDPRMMSQFHQDRKTGSNDLSRDTLTDLLFEKKETEMEIIGPNNDETTRMSAIGGKGIQISMVRAEDKLIYELKIALARTVDEPYGIDAIIGSTVGVGFIVTENEVERGGPNGGHPDGGMDGGPPGGGMGGGPPGGGMDGGPPGGGHARGGTGRGSGQEQNQGAIDIWANLRLATPTTVPE
jgi:hypothetical protein